MHSAARFMRFAIEKCALRQTLKLTNIIECLHDDVISDFTVDWFRLDQTLMKLDAWTWLVVKEELISKMS